MPKVNPSSAYDDDELENESYAPVYLPKEEILQLALKQKGAFLIIPQLQIMVFVAFALAFLGFVLGHNIVQDLSLEQDSEAFNSLESKLHNYSGVFLSLKEIGCAIWFFLSSICGSLAFILPVFIYNKIAKSHLKQSSAFLVVYDLIKAVIFKYAVMILFLGLIFKFTDLVDFAVLGSFVLAIVGGTFFAFYKALQVNPMLLVEEYKQEQAKRKAQHESKKQQESKAE